MNASHTTNSGTAIFEPDQKEYDAFLESAVRAAFPEMSVADFRKAYEAGELDDSDSAVSELASLLQAGQNGP